MQPKLRVAVVSRLDVRNIHLSSGTPYFMVQALEQRFGNIATLGPQTSISMQLGRYLHGLARLAKHRYAWTHSIAGSRELGQKFSALLNENAYDLIVAPFGASEIAHLKTTLPIIYLTDMTFRAGRSYYDSFSNLLPFTAMEGERIEQRAARKATRIVVPSDWAARSFKDDYGCDPAKIDIIPFGANLQKPPAREEALTHRNLDVCRLLFLGVSWERKGGSLALRILQSLIDAGIKAELLVCGCRPPSDVSHPCMRVFPFLRKNNLEDMRQLRQLFLTSTFLLLPSQAEAWGLVFSEASAYGLPSLTRNTGGTASVVRHGFNGFCLPAEASAGEYTEVVIALLKNPEQYQSLCTSARNEYESRLNWEAWSREMAEVFTSALNQQPAI